MKDGKAETFEEWIEQGEEMFKDEPDILILINDPAVWDMFYKEEAEGEDK